MIKRRETETTKKLSEAVRIRRKEAETDLRGLRSMQTFSKMSLRNCGALSCTTCWTLRRDFRYSRKRLMKPTKCSAVRIEPGTASDRKRGGQFVLMSTIRFGSSSKPVQKDYSSNVWSLMRTEDLIETTWNAYYQTLLLNQRFKIYSELREQLKEKPWRISSGNTGFER